MYISNNPVNASSVVCLGSLGPDMADNNITGGTRLSEQSLEGSSTRKPVLPAVIDLVSKPAQLPDPALHGERQR